MEFFVNLKTSTLSFSTRAVFLVALKHFYNMNDMVLNWAKIGRFLGERTRKNKDRASTREEIGDLIHGYISPTIAEYRLLQLPVLKRLHHIRQTALAFTVFPGSVTARFGHVVGAMHIGGKMASQVLVLLSESNFKNLFPHTESKDFPHPSCQACLFIRRYIPSALFTLHREVDVKGHKIAVHKRHRRSEEFI